MAIFRNKQPKNPRRNSANRNTTAAFSYYAGRTTPESSKARRSAPKMPKTSTSKADKPLAWWQFTPSLLAMAAILVCLGYSLTLQTKPRLSHSTREANSLLQPDDVYERALEQHLKNSVINRSKLLINAPELEKKLERQFPELASATITIPLTSRRPILAIEPIVPVMVLQTPSGDFVLDVNGKIVLEAGQGRDEVLSKIPKVKDESGLAVKLGETALSRGDTQFIREISHQLTEKGLTIQSITLPATANEIHVRIKGTDYYVKFNTQGDARLEAGTYLAVRERLARGGRQPRQYVDVRIEEKAYYK